MSRATVSLGLIGAGRLAEAGYLPADALSDRVRIVAVADPDPERRALLAVEDVRCHSSAADLIAAGGIDGVVVASPPAAHEEAARLAAAAGLPALVEKPPAPDVAGARRIASLEPPPRVGFNRRFSLGRGMRGALPAGGLVELELRYRRFSWSPVMVRDPALLDLAPHLLDLALWTGVGDVRGVVASSSRPERVTISLEGASATARIECATDRFHRESIVVRDASGRVVHRRRLGGLVRGTFSRLRGPHPLVASLAAQLTAFARACAGEAAPELATAEDGVAAMALVGAAAESLALGGLRVDPRARGVPA